MSGEQRNTQITVLNLPNEVYADRRPGSEISRVTFWSRSYLRMHDALAAKGLPEPKSAQSQSQNFYRRFFSLSAFGFT